MLSRRLRGLAASNVLPLLVAVVGLAAGGCAGASPGLRPDPTVARSTAQVLAPSNVGELREAFNVTADRHRLIAFFSPT